MRLDRRFLQEASFWTSLMVHPDSFIGRGRSGEVRSIERFDS